MSVGSGFARAGPSTQQAVASLSGPLSLSRPVNFRIKGWGVDPGVTPGPNRGMGGGFNRLTPTRSSGQIKNLCPNS